MRTQRFWTAVGLSAVVALGAAACNDSLTDVNVNPNAPETAPEPTLFVNAVRNATSRWLGNAGLRQFSLLAQHLAEVQYPETDAYQRLTGPSTEGNFNGAYSVELRDLQVVIHNGRAANNPGYWAPALVMRTWSFGILTDLWGNVPYTQALRGDSAIIQPTYDTQEAIYPLMFAALDSATTALSATTGLSLGASDPIYGALSAANQRAAWQRFSNSLRARHAMRIVNVNPTLANQQLTAAFNAPGGVFTTNAQMAVFNWPGNGVYNNPWQVNFQTRDDHRVSTRLMSLLQATSDPRLPVYAQPAESSGEYRGLENALTHAQASVQMTTTSKPGTRLYSPSQPAYLMTTAEVKFIQAEAAARSLGGLTPAQAAGFYVEGIRASMEQWGVTGAAIDTYLARPDVAYQPGTEGLRRIAAQKWIALYSDGIQAYSEWRRTCVPSTVRPGPTATQNTVPRRLQYGPLEKTVNAANVEAAVAAQGPDAFTTRIWWDRNPTAAPTHVAGCGERS
jgi:hypothetical protein